MPIPDRVDTQRVDAGACATKQNTVARLQLAWRSWPYQGGRELPADVDWHVASVYGAHR